MLRRLVPVVGLVALMALPSQAVADDDSGETFWLHCRNTSPDLTCEMERNSNGSWTGGTLFWMDCSAWPGTPICELAGGADDDTDQLLLVCDGSDGEFACHAHVRWAGLHVGDIRFTLECVELGEGNVCDVLDYDPFEGFPESLDDLA